MTETLPSAVIDRIAANTLQSRAPAGLENARRNLPFIRQSVFDLAARCGAPITRALVIAGGPSLRRQQIVRRLKSLAPRPFLVCCDASLAACLKEEIVPDVVVSVDPHEDRVVRWFGDPKLDQRPDDDYFRRQDIDVDFRREQEKNREVIGLVDRHGARLRIALATSVAQDVTARCLEAGAELFWWNPLYDDWNRTDSYTRQVFELTGRLPCVTGLGHCGGAAWVLAHAVFGAEQVGLVGMDLGYPEGTSVVNTQYYELVRHLEPQKAERFLVSIDNPHTGRRYLTDPVYYWYRETFRDAAHRADCVTINCSGEGTLFGDGIVWQTLEHFVEPDREPRLGGTPTLD